MGSIFFKRTKESISSQVESFFDLAALDIDGNLVLFSNFKHYKAIIVVNVASSCGFTRPAYKELCQLYEQFQYLKIFSGLINT